MNIKQLIGETTDYDKKLALEEKKPKSWCKSISAFANCFGASLYLVYLMIVSWWNLRMLKVMQRKLVK